MNDSSSKEPLQELNCFKSQKVNMIKTILLPCKWLWHQMVSAALMPAAPSWFRSTCSGTGTSVPSDLLLLFFQSSVGYPMPGGGRDCH